MSACTKGQYTETVLVTSILVDGKLLPQRGKDKHEYLLIQLLITRVGKAINYNHPEKCSNSDQMEPIFRGTACTLIYTQFSIVKSSIMKRAFHIPQTDSEFRI